MADELRVDDRLAIPLAEIELRTTRSSGPGGPHPHVTASRVEAVFDVEASASLDESRRARLLERLGPVVTAVAQDGRGQYRNRELAVIRLAAKVGAAPRTEAARRPPPAPPRPEAPRRRAQAVAPLAARRLGGRGRGQLATDEGGDLGAEELDRAHHVGVGK